MEPAHEADENEAGVRKEEAPPSIKYGVPELSDVILVVEGQEFHVHRMVFYKLLCSFI